MEYSKIMSELHNPSHSPNRSGKDLSSRKVLTMKAGELLPILCKEVVPNDYFEIDTASLVRTNMPLQTAAFMRAKLHFDFFFVPSTAIWRNYEYFVYQKQQQESSVQLGSNYEPNITLEELYNCCLGGYSDSGSVVTDTVSARMKVLNLLGYPYMFGYNSNPYSSGGSLEAIGQKSLTMLPLAGYNLIYNMVYRNAWRDEPNPYERRTYNLDWISCETYAGSLKTALDFSYNAPGKVSLVQMHYHGWYSDLFMGSLPNAQFGSVSIVDTYQINKALVLLNNPDVMNDNFANLLGRKASGDNIQVKQNDSTATSLYVKDAHSTFDILALRKAMAMQKWKESNARAGWKASKQAKAFYGVDTRPDVKHEVERLSNFEFPIMVDEVTSTADTSGSSLGELGGKVIGVGNSPRMKFHAGERHGYLYCIAYIMPETEYDAIGIDPQLIRSEPFDHFNPAFENLGMVPIYKHTLNAAGNSSTFDNVLGYAPRYFEYKTDVDKVYCQFVGNSGQLKHWVTPRLDLETIANLGSIPTNLYYVNPSILNNVFGMSADGTLNTDQFMLNTRLSVKAVRPMSDLGLPNL